MTTSSLARSSAVWLSLLLIVALPLAIWLGQQGNVWTNRLVLPDWLNEPPRHSLLYSNGTFLPPVITKNTTFTPAQNPVLLTGLTTIPTGVTVTIEPGTQIFTHEFAQLEIHGTLLSNGTPNNKVTVSSNEQNTANQTWGGFLFMPGSQGTITYTVMADGSPAISCLTTSQVQITDSLLERGTVGVYATSPTCHLIASRIQGSRIGVITLPQLAPLIKTILTTTHQDIETITSVP